MKKHVKWYVVATHYVDLDNATQITKNEAKTNYTIIKTNKYYEFNYNKTIGYITNTILCKRKSQLSLEI